MLEQQQGAGVLRRTGRELTREPPGRPALESMSMEEAYLHPEECKQARTQEPQVQLISGCLSSMEAWVQTSARINK